MKTNSIRAFVLGSALCAVAVGLALTTSGCIVGTDSGYYGTSCQSALYIPWQIQNPAGGAVTCGAAGAATVVIDINGSKYPQNCTSSLSYGSDDLVLPSNNANYNVTVNLYDADGNPLAVPQMVTVGIGGCGSYTTPGPALLVVTPPTQ